MTKLEKEIIERLTRIEEKLNGYKHMVQFNRKILLIIIIALTGLAFAK